jgi:multidrug efflux system outer membrane protein
MRTSIIALAAAAAAATLAGCANLAPDYERPAAPVAANWAQPSAGTEAAPLLDWQRFYSDARLSALIALALKNNRDMRVALLNVEQARALARVSDADRWPTVNAGLIRTRAPNTSGEMVVTHQAGLQVSSYELDLFGKLRNQSDAAMQSYLASAEGARAAQITLVAGVASGYLTMQADEELLQLTQRTLATRQESQRLTKLRFDNGSASSLDLASADSALEAARATLAQAQRQRVQDENALVLLVGQSLPTDLPAAQPLAAQRLADVPSGIPSEVLTQRPDVLQAEAQLLAANANIGAARAAFFPSITLTSSLGTTSSALSDLFKNTVWTYTAQALMPIFDAGRTRANLDAKKAAREIAVATYEKSIQSAFREVADALAGRATLTEQLRAQDAQAAAEELRLKLTELRYTHGEASSLDLLDAQRSSFAARQSALQTRLAQLVNSVQLYKVLGGGVGPAPSKT